MSHVMISYRNVYGQKEFAHQLEQSLTDAGIKTWIDTKDIPRLSHWEDEIFKGIINSEYVILCLSPEYFESETCLFECYVARGYGKILLPVIAPHGGGENVFNILTQYEETNGIDQLNILDFEGGNLLGLEEDMETMKQRIIKTIVNPAPLNVNYDVFFSFKSQQAKFATQVADDLNANGIKSYIHTRSIDVGADWRKTSWNAELMTSFHLVILSPEVADSRYITMEVLVSRTKKTQFIPVLTPEYANNKVIKDAIRDALSQDNNLTVLNDIQWFIPDKGYDAFIQELIKDIKFMLEREK